MKTHRFSSKSIHAATVILAVLTVAGLPAAGEVTFRLGGASITFETDSKKLAKALAQQVGEVQKKFDEKRRALHSVKDSRGEPAYVQQDVADLVTNAEKDLDQAITRVGEPKLEGLRAWAAEELRPIHEELAPPVGHTAASFPSLSTPRAIAVIASLGRIPLPELASVKAAAPKKAPKAAAPKKTAPKQEAPKQEAPQPAMIPAEKANGLLDQVGEVVSRIFFLAAHDDLEVKLWVGSTPAPRVTFSFWPQGQVKGESPVSRIIRTNGKQDHVLRGLYSYHAAWSKGAVTQVIEYPIPAGAPAAQQSERLDLVKGTGLFCCRFGEHYCLQVTNEKECRP